ncbi:MAG: hypothetical protein LBT20_03715 [Clostridiales bacterium]|jgi:hypothetical protein|nr:hypothetical protein [Clostridiales bacterium]
MSNNTIRTKAIELETIPALAYKQKLPTGGAGIKLHRIDRDAAAAYTIDKRSGKAIAYGKIDETLFPEKAVTEAIDATAGLPYSIHSRVVLKLSSSVETLPQEEEPTKATTELLASKEYAAILKEYTKESGKLDYTRLNKDFIQFAAKSKTLVTLAAKSAPLEELLLFTVKNRAAYLSKSKDNLSDEQISALIDVLNEIDPRSAFKELSAYLKKLLGKK